MKRGGGRGRERGNAPHARLLISPAREYLMRRRRPKREEVFGEGILECEKLGRGRRISRRGIIEGR